MITVKVDSYDTIQRLKKLSKDVGLTVRDVLYEEARLSGNAAIRYTYPRKVGDGKRAIERDVAKLFTAPDTLGATWTGKGVPDGYTAVKLSDGAVILAEAGEAGDMAETHKAGRNQRTGRVRKPERAAKIGKWAVASQKLISKSDFKRYVAGVQKRVGQQKAGWLPAAEHFAKLARGAVKAPAWVTRQEKKIGTWIDTLTPGGIGTLALLNEVPYWPQKKKDALETLVHGIAQKRLDRVTKGQMKKLEARFTAEDKAAK